MKIRIIASVLFSIVLGNCFASPNTIKEYDRVLFEVYNLRPIEARKLLSTDKYKNTNFCLYSEFLYNLSEVIEVTLYEDEQHFEAYNKSLKERLKRIDINADKNAPDYHIIMGDIYSHAAMAHIMNNDFIAGFKKLLKANKSTRLNEKIHPDYWYNNKLNGTLNVCFDMMVPVLKTISGMFGLKGDAEKGYRQLNQYLKDVEDYPGLKSEAMLYYGFALKMAKDEERAYEILSDGIDTAYTPALTTFLASNIMFLTARNEEALSYMSFFPRKEIEVPFHHADYLLGKEKLNSLDTDAGIYLKKFLDKTKSKNYSREVCIKLAHHYLIHGDTEKYAFYKNKINDYPKAKTDRDREADVQLNRPYPPHIGLLKAKYLVEGGYYQKAEAVLTQIPKNSLSNPAYKNQFNLYKAIILSHTHKPQEAIQHCKMVIMAGEHMDEHYASEAAFVAANIQFNKGYKEEAISYLKQSKKIQGQKDVYIEVIHKKATNMLNQLKKG